MKNKMRTSLMACLLMLGLFLVGCASPAENPDDQDDKSTVMPITAEEAKTRIDNGEQIIIVDVRTEGEYKAEHIPGALLVPVDSIVEEAPKTIPDKEAIYFVYCRTGNRSATASLYLVDMGYQNIYDLGGIIDWPYETESGL